MQISRRDDAIVLRGLASVNEEMRLDLRQATELRRQMKAQFEPMSKNAYNIGEKIVSLNDLEARAFAGFFDAHWRTD